MRGREGQGIAFESLASRSAVAEAGRLPPQCFRRAVSQLLCGISRSYSVRRAAISAHLEQVLNPAHA